METPSYFDYCEGMWGSWTGGKSPASDGCNGIFQLDYCPEPYLVFSEGTPTLHFLTTNPGRGMAHQHRDALPQPTHAVIVADASYRANANRLADFYWTQLTGPARVRIGAMKRLAGLSGKAGLMQVECLPYHSTNLPNKSRIARLCEDGALRDYVAELKGYLHDKDVIAVSAVGSSSEIRCKREALSPWLRWQCELMGFDFSTAEKHDIVHHKTTGRVTGALLLSRNGSAKKGLFLMMGSNSLPAANGLEKIALAISR